MEKIYQPIIEARSSYIKITKELVKEALKDSKIYAEAREKIKAARWRLSDDYSEELLKKADSMIIEEALSMKITPTEQ